MSQSKMSNNESKKVAQGETLRAEGSKPQVNVTMITILWLIFLIGCCCGRARMFGNDLDQMQILYVSRSEIMALEKSRFEEKADPEGRMFFGKINKAIDLIRKEALNYEDDHHRLIFVGDNYVEGKNTKSISKLVYQKVINQLRGKINAGEQKVSNNK